MKAGSILAFSSLCAQNVPQMSVHNLLARPVQNDVMHGEREASSSTMHANNARTKHCGGHFDGHVAEVTRDFVHKRLTCRQFALLQQP